MRSTTLVCSLLAHGMLAILALRSGSEHRASQIAVAVVNEARRKEPPKKEPPPPPPPKAPPPPVRPPRSASRPVAPPPTPVPAVPEPRAARTHRSAAPVDTGLTFGNTAPPEGGTGVGLVAPAGAAPPTPPKVEPPPTKRHPLVKKEEPPEDLCEEAPSKPVALQQPTQIEYTAQARADGIEGRLVLRVVVAADGTVSEVVVVQGVEPALDAGAVAAVKTWTFKPALRCGKPVAGGTLTLARRFELGD